MIITLITLAWGSATGGNTDHRSSCTLPRNLETVERILKQAIQDNDIHTMETIRSHAKEQVGDYALLILLDFYHDLNPRSLEIMEKRSPARWKELQHYFGTLREWASLARQADYMLGRLSNTTPQEGTCKDRVW